MEIKPEPNPQEREAILRALADLERGKQPSTWWEAGLREAVDGDSETED